MSSIGSVLASPFLCGSSRRVARYDLVIESWQQRSNRFQEAIQNWDDGKDLPPASALGIPAAAGQ